MCESRKVIHFYTNNIYIYFFKLNFSDKQDKKVGVHILHVDAAH